MGIRGTKSCRSRSHFFTPEQALHGEIVGGKRHCDDTICCSAGPNPYKPNKYLNWDLELSKVINAVSNSLLRKVVGNNGAALSVEMVPMPPLVFNDGTIEPSELDHKDLLPVSKRGDISIYLVHT